MSGPSTFRSSLGVLGSSLYARFMVAEFISMVGSWMQTQAQQFLVEEQARTSLDQALVSFALMIVIPLFGPWGGSLADRADRRRILFIVLTIQALLAASIGYLVQSNAWAMWHLIIVAIILGITHAFESPAYSALLPQLVDRAKLSAAIALDRSVFHAARIIGPALAGLCVASMGTASAFYANALSFLCPLLILCTIPSRKRGTEHEEQQRKTGFMDGWRYVRGDAPTRRMVLIMAANAFFCSPFVMVLLTFYARRTLHLPPMQIGWLMSLTGIGALIASFALLGIAHDRRLFFMRLGAAISFVAMLMLAAANSFTTAAIAYSGLTLGLNFLFGIGNQLIQERTPEAMRGRVSSIAMLSFVGVIPFSGIATALLDQWLGMESAIVVCAIGYAIVVTPLLARAWAEEK